jgi:ribonuclease HI
MYRLQFDGMLRTLGEDPCRTGLLGYGWLLTRNGVEIAQGFGLYFRQGLVNSNLAEYLALVEGLDAMVDLRIAQECVEVQGDARSVIDQMVGAISVRSASTRRLYQRANKLAGQFNHLTWKWVPCNKNKLADRLSRRGLRQLSANMPADEALSDQLKNQKDWISLLDLRLYHA